ncbi:MAG: hypothetical protein A2V77_19065 [Anaeromyxobacter sp. RBG_16_69_14]|nr:MAG: hypothetical protein A2V77_19065 [Anaeromyxobacter sp. RBG_16_69_14]
MPTMLVALALIAASPPEITADALRARYREVRLLTADVVQVKEGRFWARPFESHIRLRYTPQRVTWETLSPVPSTVVIEGGSLTVRGPSGEYRELAGMANDPRFAALLRFLRALLALDLASLERDFVLDYGPGELVARPRPGPDVPLFTGVRLRFDRDLELVSLELETASERTRLTFHHVRHEPAPPRPGTPEAR